MEDLYHETVDTIYLYDGIFEYCGESKDKRYADRLSYLRRITEDSEVTEEEEHIVNN